MRSSRFAFTLGALALGTALSALPALAQDYHYPVGRGANDGGGVTAQTPNAGQNTGSRSNEQSAGPKGNHYAFGAQGQPQGRGVYNYSPGATPSQYKYPMGRGANDGGVSSAQLNNGEQTSGSAANREANRSNSDTYSFGAQGQPPRSVR